MREAFIRHHPGQPLCGDIWYFHEGYPGLYMVVDFVDPLNLGLTFSDGKRLGCGYRDIFERLVTKKATLVSTFEDVPFPECDSDGSSRDDASPQSTTIEASLGFIQQVLALHESARMVSDQRFQRPGLLRKEVIGAAV